MIHASYRMRCDHDRCSSEKRGGEDIVQLQYAAARDGWLIASLNWAGARIDALHSRREICPAHAGDYRPPAADDPSREANHG